MMLSQEEVESEFWCMWPPDVAISSSCVPVHSVAAQTFIWTVCASALQKDLLASPSIWKPGNQKEQSIMAAVLS